MLRRFIFLLFAFYLFKNIFLFASSVSEWEVRKCHGAKEKIAQLISKHICYNIRSYQFGTQHDRTCQLFNPAILFQDLMEAGFIDSSLKRSRCINKAFRELKEENFYGDYELETFRAIIMQEREILTLNRLKLTQKIISNRSSLLLRDQVPRKVWQNLSEGFKKKLPELGQVSADMYMMAMYTPPQIEELGKIYHKFSSLYYSHSGYVRLFPQVDIYDVRDQFQKSAGDLSVLLIELSENAVLIEQKKTHQENLIEKISLLKSQKSLDFEVQQNLLGQEQANLDLVQLELDQLQLVAKNLIRQYNDSLLNAEKFFHQYMKANGFSYHDHSRVQISSAIQRLDQALEKLEDSDVIKSSEVKGTTQLLDLTLEMMLTESSFAHKIRRINSSEKNALTQKDFDDLELLYESFNGLSTATLTEELIEVKFALENLKIEYEKKGHSQFQLSLNNLKENLPHIHMSSMDYLMLQMGEPDTLSTLISDKSPSTGKDYQLDSKNRRYFAIMHFKKYLNDIKKHSNLFKFSPPLEDVFLAGLITNRIKDEKLLTMMENPELFPKKKKKFHKFIDSLMPFVGAASVINPIASTVFLIGTVTWNTVRNMKNQKEVKNDKESYFCIDHI